MLLKLYNLNHEAVAGITSHKDARVESELSNGEKTLYFSWHQQNPVKIPHEYYIRTDTDEYVVKENSKASGGYRNIVAKLNVEDIEGRIWKDFTAEDCTAKEMADYALTDTGWTCVCTVPDSRIRSVSMKKVTAYSVLMKLLEAFTCEIKFDTLNKVVYLKDAIGEDKGVYFIKGLNLVEITDNADSYDYATRIIPVGADNLTIESVNNGVEYLDNHQYSNKVKAIIWEDSNYKEAQALKEDAEKKLKEISKPKKTLQAKTIDLARMKPEYAVLSYSVGDTVTLIDNETGIKEKQRITKTVEYLENPAKNTCDISNSVLSFEEMQQKLFAAAECIGNITTDNGTIKGSTVDRIDVTQIIGMDRYLAEDIDELRANYIYAQTEIGTPSAVIGKGLFTETETTTLKVTDQADIEIGYIVELHADTQYGEYAKFKVVESDNISALEARIDKITSTEITTEYLEANYAMIDYANVDTASIRQGFLQSLMVNQGIIADRVQAGEIIATNTLTGVNIYADDITAGTLSVDRLILRGNDKSLVYALNNSGELVSAQVDTLDAYLLTDRTITADKIVAGSVTASEINVGNLISDGFVGANKLTANNVDVNNLFAQTITATGSIQSGNYKNGTGGFSYAGLKLIMATGEIISRKFKIDSSGNAEFSGTVKGAQITGGKIEGVQITGGEIEGSQIISEKQEIHNGTEYTAQTKVVDGFIFNSGFNDGCVRSAKFCNGILTAEEESGTYRSHMQAERFSIYKKTGTNIYGAVFYVDAKINTLNTSLRATFETIEGTTGTFSGNVTSSGTLQGATLKVTGDAYFANGTTYYINSSASAKLRSLTLDNDITQGSSTNTSSNIQLIQELKYNNVVYRGAMVSYPSSGIMRVGLFDRTNDAWKGYLNFAPDNTIRAGKNLLPVSADNIMLGSSSHYWSYVCTTAMRLKPAGYNVAGRINCQWKDGNLHDALLLDGDGLSLYLGWVGSGSYKTNVVLRGQSVRLGSTSGAVVTSDERLKNSFKTMEKYEGFFDNLEPYFFKYNNGSSGRYHSGFKAQQILDALEKNDLTSQDFAGFVKYSVNPDNEEYRGYTEEYGLIYTEFVALNTYMIQKTRKEAKQQKEEFEEYKKEAEAKIENLEKRIEDLENIIKKQLEAMEIIKTS